MDAVVIGAGCAGAAMVRALAEADRGARVAWVGQRDDPAPRRISFWGPLPGWATTATRACSDGRWAKMAFGRPGQRQMAHLTEPYISLRSDRWLAQTRDQLPDRQQFIEGWAARLQPPQSVGDPATVTLADGRILQARHVFCSVPSLLPRASASPTAAVRRPAGRLEQSFFGYEVETDRPCFDPGTVTLMDFDEARTDQFVYALPFGERRALVEPTRISVDEPIDERTALAAARQWVKADFRILRREGGVIPMRVQPMPVFSPGITAIGAAGGCQKASTGYAFARSLRQADALAKSWRRDGVPRASNPSSSRHRFLDSVMLLVLEQRDLSPLDVFERLFIGSDFRRLLRFMDERSSLADELSVIARLPVGLFLSAALQASSPRAASGRAPAPTSGTA